MKLDLRKKHRPRTWSKWSGIRIMDPDGWREDGKNYNAPISHEEWTRRMMRSTVCRVPIYYAKP